MSFRFNKNWCSSIAVGVDCSSDRKEQHTDFLLAKCLMKHRRSLRVEVFRVVNIKFMAFRDVMPCIRRSIRSQVAINDNIEMGEVKRMWKFILTAPVGRLRTVR
jgi:hypothetical protein